MDMEDVEGRGAGFGVGWVMWRRGWGGEGVF